MKTGKKPGIFTLRWERIQKCNPRKLIAGRSELHRSLREHSIGSMRVERPEEALQKGPSWRNHRVHWNRQRLRTAWEARARDWHRQGDACSVCEESPRISQGHQHHSWRGGGYFFCSIEDRSKFRRSKSTISQKFASCLPTTTKDRALSSRFPQCLALTSAWSSCNGSR